MADTYSTKKINELDIVNSADDSDIMMVGKTSTGTTSAITKSNFLKEVTTTLNNHASEIVTNAENITANADEIKTNTNNIAQNTSNINANAEDIAKNAEDIAQNASDIAELNSALSELDSSVTTALSSKENLLSTQYFSVDNLTVSASSYADGTLSCSRSGYTALGIVGTRLNNASSSGGGNSMCFINRFYLSGTTISYQVRNTNSSDAKILIGFYVLYVAN